MLEGKIDNGVGCEYTAMCRDSDFGADPLCKTKFKRCRIRYHYETEYLRNLCNSKWDINYPVFSNGRIVIK